jgi:hypothetical protein
LLWLRAVGRMNGYFKLGVRAYRLSVMQQNRCTMQRRAPKPTQKLFCRFLLCLLALGILENTVLAIVCESGDVIATLHAQAVPGELSHASVSAPGSAVEAGCCILCNGCTHGGGCCSHAATPLQALSSFLPTLYGISPVDATRSPPYPCLNSDSFRPPITV